VIELIFPDGTHHQFPESTTGEEVARQIGARLARDAVAVELDGDLLDLRRSLPQGGSFRVVTAASEEGRSVLRHSAAHVLAQAVLSLFPGAQFAIGPAITDGFYYDFDIGRPFTPEDLERIEAKMAEIIAADQPFVREEFDTAAALQVFADQTFKTEIIQGVDAAEGAGDRSVSVYRNNGFVDLCRGPHLPSTGRLAAVKLLRTAGAYWRGDEQRQQLQRIYGTAWETRELLDDYLHRLEEAERRDHRRLGAELDLFSFPPELGSGLAVWHPKGAQLRQAIEDYSRRTHLRNGYQLVFTPHVAKAELWETSGHLRFYAAGMFPAMELDEGHRYHVKPMNCPFHILVYRTRLRSYKELPIRLFELGTVYRYERSGVVHGLLRARGFTQDDSHIFCMESQLPEELSNLLAFVLMVLEDFGFTQFEAELSTRPEEFVGRPEAWERATAALSQALSKADLAYRVAEGEGAFYGPKIDVHVRDAIGRRWQISTLQVDFAQPDNFGLEFGTADNHRQRPVMIHRALLGSIERFTGILIEHFAGSFPAWLAPVQALVIPVADRHAAFATEVASALIAADIRVEVDASNDTVGEKIRNAVLRHYPVAFVVGDQDLEAKTVGVRRRGEDAERRGVPLAEAVAEIAAACTPPR